MGKGGGGGDIPTVTAQQVDYKPIIEQYQKGADVIEKQYPIALEQYLQYAGQGTRDAIQANTAAIMTTLPYGSAANESIKQLRDMLGMAPESKTSELSYRMSSLSQQLNTAPFISMDFVGDMQQQLTKLTNQLDRAEEITDPELREAYKQQLTPQFESLANGIEGDRLQWGNFQKYLSSDYSKKPTKKTEAPDYISFNFTSPTGQNKYESGGMVKINALTKTGEIKTLMGEEANKIIDKWKEQGGETLYTGKDSPERAAQLASDGTIVMDQRSTAWSNAPGGNGPMSPTNRSDKDLLEAYQNLDKKNEDKFTEDMGKYVAFDQLTDDQKKELGFKDVPTSELAGITGLNDYIKRYDQLSETEKIQLKSLTNFVSQVSPNVTDIGQRFGEDYTKDMPKGSSQEEIMAKVRATPNYQFNLDEGTRQMQRSQASRGVLNSGQAALEATQYGQNYANQAYNNQLSQLSGLAGLTLGYPAQQSQLQQLGGQQQAAANNEAGQNRQASTQGIANARMNAYNLSGNAMMNIGIANMQANLQGQIANQQSAIAQAQMSAQQSMGFGQIAGSLIGAFL